MCPSYEGHRSALVGLPNASWATNLSPSLDNDLRAICYEIFGSVQFKETKLQKVS